MSLPNVLWPCEDIQEGLKEIRELYEDHVWVEANDWYWYAWDREKPVVRLVVWLQKKQSWGVWFCGPGDLGVWMPEIPEQVRHLWTSISD